MARFSPKTGPPAVATTWQQNRRAKSHRARYPKRLLMMIAPVGVLLFPPYTGAALDLGTPG
jgi:hypothetical protein